ncbi:hypothetical protein Pan189_17600 [Stratiformator vulcanicus]|uniref:Uncharacterized protein n=1 Tax=Stratiformator vulcanicus TaxID=2527980 RepID=A0A517R0G2_9PLAN|nr:hypothetical protein Pan189_17600 [Stratiformator vulcanicus]
MYVCWTNSRRKLLFQHVLRRQTAFAMTDKKFCSIFLALLEIEFQRNSYRDWPKDR